MSLSAATPSRKPLPPWARVALAAVVLNEVRGIVTVALTAPVWWPLLRNLLHGRGG